MKPFPEGPPRFRALEPDEVPEVKDIFDAFLKERGVVPNMFRTLARRPEHMRTMMDHFQIVMRRGSVPSLLKELISVRVSALNGCHYWLDSHTALAARLGGSQQQIDALLSEEIDPSPYTDAELAALRFSDALSLHSSEIPDETFAELQRHYDEGEVVEICMVAGLFAYFNFVNNALRTAPTR